MKAEQKKESYFMYFMRTFLTACSLGFTAFLMLGSFLKLLPSFNSEYLIWGAIGGGIGVGLVNAVMNLYLYKKFGIKLELTKKQ